MQFKKKCDGPGRGADGTKFLVAWAMAWQGLSMQFKTLAVNWLNAKQLILTEKNPERLEIKNTTHGKLF